MPSASEVYVTIKPDVSKWITGIEEATAAIERLGNAFARLTQSIVDATPAIRKAERLYYSHRPWKANKHRYGR